MGIRSRTVILALTAGGVLLSAGCVVSRQPIATPSTPTPTSAASEQAADSAMEEAQKRLAARDFAGAVAPLSELARLKPDAPGIFGMLGSCVLRSPNPQSFLEGARLDLERDPRDPVALTIATNALTGPENQKERLTLMRRLTEVRPDDFELRLTLAQELVNAHFYSEARKHLDLLLAAPDSEPRTDTPAPDKTLPYYLRGKAAFYETSDPTQYAAAEADFAETVKRDPKFGWPYLFLGRIRLAQNQPREALEVLESAKRYLPGNAEPLFEIARAYRALGDAVKTAAAEREFRRLKDLEWRCTTLVTRCGAFPKDFELHLQTANALMEKGDLAKASVYVRRALSLRPGEPRARAAARRLIELGTSESGS